MQTIKPNAETPIHRHNCEEVITILKGSGRLIIEETIIDFDSNSTLIIQPNRIHQIINRGDEELLLIASLGKTPVDVYTATGDPIPLPWQI